MHTECWGSPLV